MSEQEVRCYIIQNLDEFNNCINKLLNTNNTEFVGHEFALPLYENHRRVYGGGIVDMLFESDDYIIPVELKAKCNNSGLGQLKKYIRLSEKLYNKKTKGILVCYDIANNVMSSNINSNMFIASIEENKIYGV